MAPRAAVADRLHPFPRPQGRHLYRRWSGRVRKRRQLGPLPAGRRPVRHVGIRRGQSRLPQRRADGQHTPAELHRVPGGAGRDRSAVQVSMWAMLAAPFMISVDLPHTPKTSLALITNREVMAIDRDPRDIQAREVGTSGVWIKPTTTGVAVAFLNRSNRSRVMTASDASIGLGRGLTVRDVWNTPRGQSLARSARSSRHEARRCSRSRRGRSRRRVERIYQPGLGQALPAIRALTSTSWSGSRRPMTGRTARSCGAGETDEAACSMTPWATSPKPGATLASSRWSPVELPGPPA
jgi:Alpha galactosidase C-terminal beta sandwich domain/Alpha galactosidase A